MQSEVDFRATLGQLLKAIRDCKDATNKQKADPHRDNSATIWITDLSG